MSGDGQGPVRSDRSARPGPERRGRSIGELLDETRWDRRPDDDLLSPLASVGRYFREFPWDGLEDAPGGPEEHDPSSRITTGSRGRTTP